MAAPKGNKYAAKPNHLRRRVYHNARLKQWIKEKLDSLPNQGRIIEYALIQTYGWEPPLPDPEQYNNPSRWLCDWLNSQPDRGQVIEQAIMKMYDLKPPERIE